jgi:hypothetical protein
VVGFCGGLGECKFTRCGFAFTLAFGNAPRFDIVISSLWIGPEATDKKVPMNRKHRSVLATACAAGFLLSGCGAGPTLTSSLANGSAIRGNLHGGQSPVSGSHVHLMAVSATGNGSASGSLLTTGTDGTDSIGGYVLTQGDGSFTITGDYHCTTGQYIYALATEGNPGEPGVANNTGIGEMALIGDCSVLNSSLVIQINEVTTVTAAYALRGFGTSPTQIAYSGSTLGQTGLANAFATDGNLQTGGAALAKTPAGNGTVPQKEINTLADMLASCVNTTDATSSNCTTLFDSARASGTTGTKPTNTAQAIFNIAGNPATVDITTLMTLPVATAPFQPSISSTTTPADFTMQVTYTGGGLASPYVPSIDKSGNVWVPNSNGNLVKLSPVGAALSGASGFSNGGAAMLGTGSVVDLLGNVWVTNAGSIEKFSSAGAHLLTASGGHPATTYFNRLVSDASSNIWVVANPDALGKYANDGTPLTPSSGVSTGVYNVGLSIDSTGILWDLDKDGFLHKLDSSGNDLADYADESYGAASPVSSATDSSANTWVANNNDNTLGMFTSSGVLSLFTGGGLLGPYWVTLDGAGSPWVTNLNNNSVSGFTSAGVAITPVNGYAIPTINGGFAECAVDGSGNLWVSVQRQSAVVEFVGMAVPVVTPINPLLLAQRP